MFSQNGPYKEFWGRPLKSSFLNISKMIKKIWTHVEQNKLRIESPFYWYQEKGTGPLNKGSNGV